MSNRDGALRFTRVQCSNFKGFTNFSLTLGPMTMLVGPNNAGKSTIIGAFRALSVALRTARSRRPEILRRADGDQRGYRITTAEIPISLENAQHNYSDRDAVAAFTLSNGRVLRLVFSPESGCLLLIDSEGPIVRSAADFRRQFAIDIGVVPCWVPLSMMSNWFKRRHYSETYRLIAHQGISGAIGKGVIPMNSRSCVNG